MEISWNKIFDAHDKGADTAAFHDVVEKVSSHAKRALSISQQLDQHKRPNQSLLDEFSLPTFAIDKTGRIFDNNAHAEPIINNTCWSHIDQMGFEDSDLKQIVKFLNAKHTTVFDNNSYAATQNIENAINKSLSITKDKEMFFVDVMPARLAIQFDSQELPLFMLRVSQINWDDGFNRELLLQFKITQAEAEILEYLVQGIHLNEIAELRGTTVRTTRTQLKTLQAKLHQPSQAKLVRWAMIMLLVHRDRRPPTNPKGYKTAEDIDTNSNSQITSKSKVTWDTGTRRTVTLPNGAKVDLFTFGNPNGEIMLQLHALMYAPPPSDDLFSVARKFGHYVIQPLRPGYGNSSHIAEGADLLTEITENYRLLLDMLKVPTCNLLLFGTTGSLGYQVAKNLPDRIKSIISVSTSPPMKDASSIDALPGHAKFTMSAAKYAPKLFEFLVTTARRRESNFNGWDVYFSRMIKGIKSDEDTYKRQEVKRSLYEGQRLVSHQSVKAYRQELATFMDDWLPIAQSCPQPKLIIQGTDDNTWAKQSFERFANEIDAELVWIPGGAYLMVYSHTEQVLETIDKWMASNKDRHLGYNSRSA